MQTMQTYSVQQTKMILSLNAKLVLIRKDEQKQIIEKTRIKFLEKG